jgi:AraC-like DNA-binding protein
MTERLGLEHPREWAQLSVSGAFGGLESLRARFLKHSYAPHSHPFYAIGVIECGVQQFRYRGARLETPQGSFFVVHPDEAHTGEAAQQSGFTYRVFYPSVDVMRLACQAVGWHEDSLPFIRDAVLNDPGLSKQLSDLLEDLAQPITNLEAETRTLACLTRLVVHAGDTQSVALGREPRAVQMAREYLDAHLQANTSLLELAALVDLSPYHFARVFRQATGFAPHAYLENQRIKRAKHLLRAGMSIAEVGFLVGFAHQSHFTNRFRLHVGVPPGQFVNTARSRKT